MEKPSEQVMELAKRVSAVMPPTAEFNIIEPGEEGRDWRIEGDGLTVKGATPDAAYLRLLEAQAARARLRDN